jgi:hypothetical protein
MEVYKFKPEVFDNIKSDINIGYELMSPFFKVAVDSVYEIPPLEIYMYRESSSGVKKYRKTYTHLEPDEGEGLDFNIEANVLKIGDAITIKDYIKYEAILESIIIEETKDQLVNEKHYSIGIYGPDW